MNLAGKVVLVTGASRGIGRDIALEFAKAGAALALNYSKDEEGILKTLEEIKSIGVYAEKFKTDVRDYKSVCYMIKSIEERFGKLDVLVNNAGISKVSLFIDMDEEEINEVIDINLKGMVNCSHAALKCMIKRKLGSIINISSIWGSCGASCEVVYSATKGGVNSFTRAIAKEMGPSGIRVNAIAPGVINTSMNDFLSIDEKNELMEQIPLMRFGKGSDVAKLAAFLASDEAAYITGQIITIDGGLL
jgi:3-oxoacyl-[acyl-carrier protein] reductase